MADKVVTAANVLASGSAVTRVGVAGATITAGQSLYFDSADQRLKPFDANGAGLAKNFAGIALNSAAAGQPISYATSDPDFTPGCAVAEGEVLIGSATAGGICPIADAASGDYVTVIGIGKGSNKINFTPVAAGVPNA